MSEQPTTKVLMFVGEYEHPEPGSMDFFLEPVAFPMEVFNPRHGEEGEDEPKRVAVPFRAAC